MAVLFKIPKYRQKMLLIILLLLIVPLTVNAYITVKGRMLLKAEIYNRVRTINNFAREQINMYLEFYRKQESLRGETIVNYLIARPEKLKSYLKSIEQAENIIIFDKKGKIIAFAKEDTPEINFNETIYFKKTEEKIYITDMAENNKPDIDCFYIITPLRKEKEILGTMITKIPYARLKNDLEKSLSEPGMNFYIINKEGYVLTSNDPNSVKNINIEDIEKQTDRPEEGSYLNFNKDEVIGVYKVINHLNWKLITEMKTTITFMSSYELQAKNRLANIGIILFVIIVAFFASKSVDAPLKEFNLKLKEITDGNMKARVNIKTKDELEELGTRFNSMVDRLEILYNDLEKKVEERTKELDSANKQLQEMNRLKSEFLANMSHELRTPLNSIIGFSELMADCVVGDMNEDQTQCISDILESGKHLLQLINNILDLAKVESGKMELHCEKFSLEEKIGIITRTMSSLVEKKNQALSTEIAENLPEIFADEGKLKQVIINLLSNAIKFTREEGKITVKACKNEKGDFLISVRDTGIGIKEKDLETVFEEFRQVDGSYTREQEGTGLGLALTKKLVELHGGRIWVESVYGEGTTFSFTIPDKSEQ